MEDQDIIILQNGMAFIKASDRLSWFEPLLPIDEHPFKLWRDMFEYQNDDES